MFVCVCVGFVGLERAACRARNVGESERAGSRAGKVQRRVSFSVIVDS